MSVPGHTGVGGTWRMIRGFSGNLGDLALSIAMPAGDPAYQLQVDPRPTSEADGDERRTRRWYRQAKETKRGEKDGKESEHPIVASRRGTGPPGPRGAKGVPRCGPDVGTTPRASNLPACHRKPMDRVRDSATT